MKRKKNTSGKSVSSPKTPVRQVAETRVKQTPAPSGRSGRTDRETPADGATAPAQTGATDTGNGAPFPIVGIGASAGGLAAFEKLFAHMPADSDTGMSFVIVQHLDPDHKSILSELVRRYTKMRVYEVSDGMNVEPNCAYIIPPSRDLALMQGRLHLTEPSARRGFRLPIDFFFRSLAHDKGEHAIGIILSGNGTDGTLGLRTIKESGGLAVVQEPQSAEFDGMPRSAIGSGLADYVLPPQKMPEQLIAYVKRTSTFKPGPAAATPPPDVSGWLLKITAILRSHNGHDLSHYKQNTIRRRVERRMVVNQIDTLDHYVRLLRQNPAEKEILFREMLIGVTSFFRDPPAFDAIRTFALPQMMSERPSGNPLRIWVPGCSTGEEAYSLAMLAHEEAEKLGRDFVVQVFATDIDHASIDKARSGLYPANIAADVSPERLSRFFTQENKDSYRVKKTLRDKLVFAEQDVIKDPPFSKLDLISCRNLLIYLETILQRRLLPIFHYALTPGGFLLLGNSESIGDLTDLFSVSDRKWKLYRRKDPVPSRAAALAVPHRLSEPGHAAVPATDTKETKPPLRELTERMLLRNYSPACVLVNEQGEILYLHGRSGKYLELPAGDASLNLLRAAREGLKVELANALRKVMSKRQPVRYEGLEVRTNGGCTSVNVIVELADGPAADSNLMVVTFQDAPPKAEILSVPADKTTPPDEKDRHIAGLERELRIKSDGLQVTIEELETSNEELKSTNEELQSTNEELQSTNEELETSKEELQSVNEELTTVNTELQQKMDGLARANNDMSNLLAGTGIGMLFVDHQLRIQRFTPPTTQIIKLIQTDVGRPVSDLVSNLVGYDRLGTDVKSVLDTLIPREIEVQTRDAHWYLMRILPYRTVENVIEGAVLTFVDIGSQKRVEEQFRALSVDLKKRVQERIAELERVNKDLEQEIRGRQQTAARRTSDIDALSRLHDLSARMTHEDAAQTSIQTSLDAAIQLTHADMGTLQIYDAPSKTLRLAAHRGFREPFLSRLQALSAETDPCAAEALKRGERVLIDDIAQSPLFKDKPALGVFQAAGIRSIQSTPVHAHDGSLPAILSTHWTKPTRPDPGTLRMLDLLARQLAEMLDGTEETKSKPTK